MAVSCSLPIPVKLQLRRNLFLTVTWQLQPLFSTPVWSWLMAAIEILDALANLSVDNGMVVAYVSIIGWAVISKILFCQQRTGTGVSRLLIAHSNSEAGCLQVRMSCCVSDEASLEASEVMHSHVFCFLKPLPFAFLSIVFIRCDPEFCLQFHLAPSNQWSQTSGEFRPDRQICDIT